MPVCGLCIGLLVLLGLTKAEESGTCACRKGNLLVPDGYNKHMAPLEAEGKATPVYINVDIMDIDEITEERMEFSMQFYVNEYWKDQRLNVSFNNKKTLIPSEWVKDMWSPDLIFENSKGGWVYSLAIPNIVVQTHAFGFLHRFTRYNMKITCSMFLQSFPMDTQNCHLSITSFTDNSKMLLQWLHERIEEEKVDIADLSMSDIQPLKYKVLNVTPSKFLFEWPSGTFTALRANFTFVRHISSHIFNVYIPSGLVVVLSFLSFWLNVRSVPARVALGLTSLLTLSTQASQARSNLPPINYLTALDVWLFACILCVFLSLIEYATVYHFYSSKIRAKTKPSSPKMWANGRSIVSEGSDSRSETRASKVKSTPTPSKEPMGADFDEDIQFLDKVCRLLFPLFFVVFSVIYWIAYLNSSK